MRYKIAGFDKNDIQIKSPTKAQSESVTFWVCDGNSRVAGPYKTYPEAKAKMLAMESEFQNTVMKKTPPRSPKQMVQKYK